MGFDLSVSQIKDNKIHLNIFVGARSLLYLHTNAYCMKLIPFIFFSFFSIYSIQVEAQNPPKYKIKRFHLELSAGKLVPSGLKEPGIDLGFLIAIEPHYMLSSGIKLGLRMEAAMMRKNIRPSGEWFRSDNSEVSGYLFTMDYLGSPKRFQQYIGIGAGIMDIMSGDLDPLTPSTQSLQKTTYAFMIRSGIEFSENRLRAGVEYNILGATSFSNPNHYLSFKFGAMLFTKKRKKG